MVLGCAYLVYVAALVIGKANVSEVEEKVGKDKRYVHSIEEKGKVH